jgi:hypothetical protein
MAQQTSQTAEAIAWHFDRIEIGELHDADGGPNPTISHAATPNEHVRL